MPAESPAFWSWTSVVDPFHFSKATFTNYTEDFKGTLDYIWPLESQRVF
jgi:mRNA deadenylase 3'-5' endonuclease subunit Ccr4